MVPLPDGMVLPVARLYPAGEPAVGVLCRDARWNDSAAALTVAQLLGPRAVVGQLFDSNTRLALDLTGPDRACVFRIGGARLVSVAEDAVAGGMRVMAGVALQADTFGWAVEPSAPEWWELGFRPSPLPRSRATMGIVAHITAVLRRTIFE